MILSQLTSSQLISLESIIREDENYENVYLHGSTQWKGQNNEMRTAN
jgi:hypothetical protein